MLINAVQNSITTLASWLQCKTKWPNLRPQAWLSWSALFGVRGKWCKTYFFAWHCSWWGTKSWKRLQSAHSRLFMGESANVLWRAPFHNALMSSLKCRGVIPVLSALLIFNSSLELTAFRSGALSQACLNTSTLARECKTRRSTWVRGKEGQKWERT